MMTKWLLRTDTWSRLPAATRQAYVVIVSSYGGDCDQEGHGRFRKYSSAEICAHTLQHRLGVRTDVMPVARRQHQLQAQ
jgi:hypothetical protein